MGNKQIRGWVYPRVHHLDKHNQSSDPKGLNLKPMASAETTVVIIGKPGVGKSTIGNQILRRDAFQVGTEYERSRTATSLDGDLEVLLINTFPPSEAQPRSRSNEICKILTFGLVDDRPKDTLQPEDYYRSQIPQTGSLYIFVYRQERFTEDTRTQLETAIRVLSKNVSEISALVITCCEGKTQEAKESIVEDFTTNPLTKNIAKFMRLGIHCVGFPDKTKVDPKLLPHYVKDTEHSQKTLGNLLKHASPGDRPKSLVPLKFDIEETEQDLISRCCNCNVQ